MGDHFGPHGHDGGHQRPDDFDDRHAAGHDRSDPVGHGNEQRSIFRRDESVHEHDPPHEFDRPGHSADAPNPQHASESPEPADHPAIELRPHPVLDGPGGTVFDPGPDLPDHHTAPWDQPLAESPDHYGAAWAHDDGTGIISGQAAAGADPDPPPRYDGPPIADLRTSLLYGSGDGHGETAALLWRELLPGSPLPLAADGQGLAAEELLSRLAEQIDDPVSHSVVRAALSDVRR
ncbi:MAG TPA: hypothetical protein VMF07_16800 [Solirubrobacteraceae bacterium]|nr:hypothetical protein [Solirubrobacteraceae bacterium]